MILFLRYTVFSEDLTHYKIYWRSEIGRSGHIYAVLENDLLLVDGKKWLKRLSNKDQLAEIEVLTKEPLRNYEICPFKNNMV